MIVYYGGASLKRSAISFIFWFLVSAQAYSHGQPVTDQAALMREFKATIQQIKEAKPQSLEKRDVAVHLVDLSERVQPNLVDDKTFNDIVDLLDDSDIVDETYMPLVFGNLGPRSRPVVPTLLKIMRKYDCRFLDFGPAGTIRVSLPKIGITPPPEPRTASDCMAESAK
jgi:hypothetical protein